MFLFVLVLSRLVPVLFGLSAALVLARFLHDRYREAKPLVARTVFIALILTALAALGPFVYGSTLLVLACAANARHDWERADHYFYGHWRVRGSTGEVASGEWGQALMHLHRWQDAEQALLSSVRRASEGVEASPLTIRRIGICRYYAGRYGEAEHTLRAVADGADAYLAEYFLGRIAERRSPGEALELYTASLAQEPLFFPSLYQTVRLRLLAGDSSEAEHALTHFAAAAKTLPPYAEPLASAVRAGVAPPEKEFIIVEASAQR